MADLSRLAVLLGALGLSGCASGGTYHLNNGPQVPAAQGTVKSSVGDNGNTRLKIDVEHLALPDKVQAGSSVFVVWANPGQGAGPQNLGALQVSDKLEGKLDTVTPLRNFRLEITPEASATAQSQNNPPVLTAQISRR